MRIRKVVAAVAMALSFGFAIGGPLYLVGSQFHKSAHAAGDHEAKGRAAFVKGEPESYLEKWADPVAIATLLLFGVTGLLAIFTYRLFRSAVIAASEAKDSASKALDASIAHTEMLVKIERGFLAGGGPCRDHPSTGQKVFRLEVANYGKTPVFLCHYDTHFDTLDNVRAGPQEVFPWFHYADWIPPNPTPRPLRWCRVPQGKEVVYGAFWYLDWQQQPHIFRFILRIDQAIEQLGFAGVDESYTYWD